MDDPQKYAPQSSENKNILPDVVHSQQIPAIGEGVADEAGTDASRNEDDSTQDVGETESISEHLPSQADYSTHSEEDQNKLTVDRDKSQDDTHIPPPHSPLGEAPLERKQSPSWPLDNAVSDVHISEESPINLASSEVSKEATQDNKSAPAKQSEQETIVESPRSDYLDSLISESSQKDSQGSAKSDNNLNKESDSDDIIKLDIRGQGVPKYSFPTAKIFFGPPPEGSTVEPIDESNMKPIPIFPNLLSPFLVGASDHVQIGDVFHIPSKDASLENCVEMNVQPDVEKTPEISYEEDSSEKIDNSTKSDVSDKNDNESPRESLSEKSDNGESPKECLDRIEQSDLLVEEITVDDELKEREVQEESLPKSMPEETMSFSTMTTDYKTICEEYQAKLVHLEAALTKRDELIEELTVSLQRSVRERDDLELDNRHLMNQVSHLQHVVAETPSEHDTLQAQLSDFIKYQTLIKDDSTKFYSALMSGESSVRSSNGEKETEREEITVNYSRSDLKSDSDDFQTGFENKINVIISKFEEHIEENLRNKLRESLIQVLCEEIGKMRIDYDTEVKELESQLSQDKSAFVVETRRLRELLASVKAGSADIDELRTELSIKHEKELENLRTYFEKKCSDMERSYSEEVWRGRCASALGSMSSLEGAPDGTGDHARRRTRSADLPSLSLEFQSTPLEQAVKQVARKYEQQIEDMKTEHIAYVNELLTKQRESVASFEEQISQLKSHIQNSESNVLYPQDIDLELEKAVEVRLGERLDAVREQIRLDVVNHLQEQLQVLLSDPDAEVSSWPHELIALRDKIHGERQEKEVSSVREEVAGGDDKWKQRRNFSFDQNRHLDEVTKERDSLRRVAVSLHSVVGQLVSYCAHAEDELNRTVLGALLSRLLPLDQSLEESSRPSSPNVSLDLNSSALSRTGKHVHFAPDLNSILTDLDEESIVVYLQQQRDLSTDIKRELEHSLRRLRAEAHSLLDLSQRLPLKRDESKMVEGLQITEIVQDMEARCENCHHLRKSMEEAVSECLQREGLLRADLDAAMGRIAQLMTQADVIAEGYGTGTGLRLVSPHPRRSSSEPGTLSPGESPRHSRELRDWELLLKERDDLSQQLEAANRQLRSTRQFVEEQATERESERDEFARRLQDLRDENSRLSSRLQSNARILSEVEQLEAQTREMNQIIAELEAKKASTGEDLKVAEEKTVLLRDIIANLEQQLEHKVTHEKEILKQLEEMKVTIEDRDSKMRSLLGELEAMKTERMEQSDVKCERCGLEEDRVVELMDRVKEQCTYLESALHRRSRTLERSHEQCSASCSERSEDVSQTDRRELLREASSPDGVSPVAPPLLELSGVWDGLTALARAEDAALKRIHDLEMQRAQLKDVAQEVRAERDVLQARMSEQALKISSLSARLQQQRNDAEALSHHATSQLTVQLHDALAEVQRLKEELDSKEKQLSRMKQHLDERDKLNEQHSSLYGNSCNPKDKVIILERELSQAQTRIAQLEQLAVTLERDKDELHAAVRDKQRALAEKEDQLQELMALKLDEDKDEKSEVFEGKASGRTLSDIVSISEFDEQDLQMRRAELKVQNLNISGTQYVDRTHPNKTLPPDVSSLNIEFADHFELPNYTPRADSLPAHLTSTQNRDVLKEFKRNVNETTMFGTLDAPATAQKIRDNCSMYPNREVDDTKDNSVEPKKINFSLEPTMDNKSNSEEFPSLRELGITLDVKQENFPDILTQLKREIKKSRLELEGCKSELKNAEEQLCEFPALKEEVEKLKGLLENTMATMENDKKFYENQLENFSSNKKLLEQRLTSLSQDVNDKSKDLHLLKEDILRRENMILELAKEKRNLTNRMTELEVKIDELQSRNSALEKYELENHQLREKASELQKLHQLVSEKNQQIDSLNLHLDRLDDMQRRLDDKTEEFDNLKEAYDEKSNELFQLQNTVEAINADLAKITEDNENLNSHNKELKLKLSKLEKEQENASIKLQNSETELERVNSLNTELTLKIEELKLLTIKLKDKETEIEILHEDIDSFHEEIAALKEQLKMVSRSPSPRSKSGDEKKTNERISADKKQLMKIKKQISLLQHELDFNKKELNDQAFELAKARLDVTELRTNISQLGKDVTDKDNANAALQRDKKALEEQTQALQDEKNLLTQQLNNVVARMREESNVSELRSKLQQKVERCNELEAEIQDMRDLIERLGVSSRRSVVSESRALAVRSPTAELERAVRDQLDYSHTLDEDIMEQILSASSDEREDIPRLALNTSKSSSSIQSSSSERMSRLRAENEKLLMQVNNLEARLKDKDALITELNRVRDKLVQESESSRLRLAAERDNSARLQLLLNTHKDTAHTLQNQDSNMIQILKKRLESLMASELELEQRWQASNARAAALETQLLAATTGDPHTGQLDNSARLSSEVSLLKSKLEVERTKCGDLQAAVEHAKEQARTRGDASHDIIMALKNELADVQRQKHEASVELVRTKELLHTQSDTIAELEKKLTAATLRTKPTVNDALTEIETHKSDLSRDIATLKRCLESAFSAELNSLKQDKLQLTDKITKLEAELRARGADERDQAIRYLHGRCLRLESCRKALVWQKRYLQRVVSGYTAMERELAGTRPRQPTRGKGRFRSAVTVVVAVLRMNFLVRRRLHVRALSASCLLRSKDNDNNTPASSRPARTQAAPSAGVSVNLARRVLKHDLRLNLPASPGVGDLNRRSPYNTSSPREEGFILSSPRGEVAASYLNKLELVSRCLSRALQAPTDTP